MPKSFTDQFNIEKKKFDDTGALDIILDIDTKYFIDPALLRICETKEFVNSAKNVETYFSNIITLLRHSKKYNDMFWKRADKLLHFKEIKGTCLGYSNDNTNGNAIGAKLRKDILQTIKTLTEEGDVDPIIFELLGVFQEKMGCDRISDLITFIIKDDIVQYSNRVLIDLGIRNPDIDLKREDCLCDNIFNNKKILLLPKELLSPLPLAEAFDDIDVCCSENQRVRDEINQYLDLGTRNKLTKQEIKNLVENNINFRNEMIKSYKKVDLEKYDFTSDRSGGILWYSISQEQVDSYPLQLDKPINDKELYDTVKKICYQFRTLIEDNGLWRLLYYNDKVKHESAAQLLFYGIADSYCKANNIDLSREVNNGRGPVDFKLSKGAKRKVLVEIKLTSNGQLLHGFEKQLPIYMKQEETNRAIYLIIDNGHRRRLDDFQDYYNKNCEDVKEKIEYIIIDGNRKESASKA